MASGGILWRMKISEIKNNLFGLSDSKGLISENTFYEGEKAAAWAQAFFGDKANEKYLETDKNPRISYTSQNAGEFRDALHRFHHPDIDGVPVTYETWQQQNPGVTGTKYWPTDREYNEIPFFKLSNQYFFNKEKVNSWIDAKVELNMRERSYDENVFLHKKRRGYF